MRQANNQKQKVLGRIFLFVSVVLVVGQGWNSTSGSNADNLFATGEVFTSPEEMSRTLKLRGWNGFTQPDSSADMMGLQFSEGYQPGKIPVVFIHGLLSDTLTRHDTILALRSDSSISDHYQFWTFRYLTGETYLKAAADLRTALTDARESLDPTGPDRSLEQMVPV